MTKNKHVFYKRLECMANHCDPSYSEKGSAAPKIDQFFSISTDDSQGRGNLTSSRRTTGFSPKMLYSECDIFSLFTSDQSRAICLPKRLPLFLFYDKKGLLDLAKGLIKQNVRLLASGGTSKMIRESGFPVEDVSAITHAPEMLGGRVKTLHPSVHAGILARDLASDEKDLAEQKTLTKSTMSFATFTHSRRQSIRLMLQSRRLLKISILFLEELEKGDVTERSRKLYALKAFEHTADYDASISDIFPQAIRWRGCANNLL
ncbi:hypothetical protein EYC84_007236 [Monilinia fructicola]|uniref:MGS-like domain-containing protein n=1 Tax=Monilinia fructicola TaxID=38448 RepID=A0A5M9K607_MONFR|nr:hypothetical protein EYC84_007236 [Monilinia fructicola]